MLYKPVRSTMALIKMVSSLRYELLPASLARGQKRGQPLAMFISLMGLWKDVELTSGLKASMMCSLLFWSKSINVTWKEKIITTNVMPSLCSKGHIGHQVTEYMY